MDSDTLWQTDVSLQNISESVFKVLCHIVGTSQRVAMRRDVADFRDMMEKSPLLDIPTIQMTTGSRREGFQFMGSDTDVMIWSEDVKVIWDMKQAFNYDKGKHTLILSYSSESPPGYTLLVLMECVYRACISMTTIPFISSSTLRRKLFSDILPDFTEHGPCSRGYMNRMEYDVAQCFACDIWPPSASQWIARSHDWPGSQLVNEIVKGGCHFVPIGHKQGNFEFDEWRISFSLAEQKLVYSMNHCQFLTYGLLKLFLKEVINDGLSTEDKLLCSYHMKTAVLWVLQQNTIRDWRPQNLLEGFRVCFKFILKCVYEGVCPNFFIPENNMFLSNIHGKAQNDLFTRLYALYERGLASLLDSSFIRPYLFQELNNHGQNTCTDEPILISEIVTTFQELGICNLLCKDNLHDCIQTLQRLEQLINRPLTQYQLALLQNMVTTVFQSTAFLLHKEYFNKSRRNKLTYTADKISRFILKLVFSFGEVSEGLFLSMYFYRTCRYMDALSTLDMTKVKLNQTCIRDLYQSLKETEVDARKTEIFINKMKILKAGTIKLEKRICYIKELFLEQQQFCLNSIENQSILFIRTILLLQMLRFLCFTHIDPVKAQSALQELQSLVYLDHLEPPCVMKEDISWQILRLCQQISAKY